MTPWCPIHRGVAQFDPLKIQNCPNYRGVATPRCPKHWGVTSGNKGYLMMFSLKALGGISIHNGLNKYRPDSGWSRQGLAGVCGSNPHLVGHFHFYCTYVNQEKEFPIMLLIQSMIFQSILQKLELEIVLQWCRFTLKRPGKWLRKKDCYSFIISVFLLWEIESVFHKHNYNRNPSQGKDKG